MRTIRNLKKSTVAKFIGLFAIVLCIALTLTFALTPSLNTAFADIGEPSFVSYDDYGTTRGSAANCFLGDRGVLNASHFNFPGNNPQNVWILPETFNDLRATATNHEVYTALKRNNGNASGSHLIGYYLGGSDYLFRGGVKSKGFSGLYSDTVRNWHVTVANYEISPFLRSIVESGLFTVTLEPIMGIAAWNNGGTFAGVFPTSTVSTAEGVYDMLYGADGHGGEYKVDGENVLYSKAENNDSRTLGTGNVNWGNGNIITLNGNTKYITIYGAGWFKGGATTGDSEKTTAITSLQFNYTITYNRGADCNEMVYADNSTPVKVAETLGVWNGTSGSGKIGNRVLEQYVPYNATVNNMTVYYAQIASQLEKYVDKKDGSNVTLNSWVSADRGTVPSHSEKYKKSAIIEFADTYGPSQFDPSNRNNSGIGGYTYNNGWIVDTDALSMGLTAYRAAGLKKVEARVTFPTDGGDNITWEHDFNIYDISAEASNTADVWEQISQNNIYVGYIHIIRNSRSNITVELYINRNAVVELQVKDHGGSNTDGTITEDRGITSTTNFYGIDTENPSDDKTALELDDYVADCFESSDPKVTTLTSAFWFKQQQLECSVDAESAEEDDAPYVWFYSVRRATTLQALKDKKVLKYSSYEEIKNEGMLPVAYGTFPSFAYNFAEGYAVVSGVQEKSYNAYNPESIKDDEVVKGVGYYMFTFYKVDLAGNINKNAEQYVQYLKVDYDKPAYSLVFEYSPNDDGHYQTVDNVFFNSNTADLTAEMKKAQWANGSARVRIVVERVNLSGNTLTFSNNDKEYLITINRSTELALFQQDDCLGRITNKNDKLSLNIYTDIDLTDIYISYDVTANKGTITIEFDDSTELDENSVEKYKTVAWMPTFEFCSVAYANATAMENDENDLNFAPSKGTAKIFIDRNTPNKPFLENGEDEYYLVENKYELNASIRNWLTTGVSLDAILNFNDETVVDNIIDFDFSTLVTVYTAVKFFDKEADFKAYKDKFEAVYKTIRTLADAGKIQGLDLDRLTSKTLSELSPESGISDFNIDLSVPNKTAGMRVIYVWVVDQAGQVSALNSYYVLVDTANYDITASMLDAVIGDKNFGKNGTISVDRTVKRGEELVFSVDLEEGYVPYIFRKNGVDVLVNYTPNGTMVKPEGGAFNQFVSILPNGDSYEITFKFDDLSTIGEITSGGDFTMSARQVLSRSVTGYTRGYNATALDLKENIRLFDITDEECDAEIKALALSFRFFEDADMQNELEVAIDAGIYYALIYIADDNPAFVLSYQDRDGKTDATLPIQFSITKATVTVTPDITFSEYGNLVQLSYTFSGDFVQVGETDDHYPRNIAGEYIRGKLKLNTQWTGPNNLIPVGKYTIIQDPDVSFVVRRINKETGDPEDSPNYNVITFVAGIQHTINQREINVTVVAESKEYRNDDEDIRFSVATDQFGWYAVEEYGSIENLLRNTVFKGYGYSAPLEGAYAFFSGGRITRVAGEAVGVYNYIPGNINVDSNYKVTLNIPDDVKYTIVKRNVVLDVSGQYSVYKYSEYEALNGGNPNVDGIRLNYTLASRDVLLAEAIAKAVSGHLKLSNPKWDDKISGYTGAFVYTIVLNDFSNDNINITFDEGAVYYIYVAEQNTVIVELKEEASIAYYYGMITKGGINYKDLVARFGQIFDVSCENGVPQFDDVKWDVKLEAGENDYLNAGSYTIIVENAKLYYNNVALDDKVVVETFTVTVNPAVITVSPRRENATKTYGQADSTAYGINYYISKINDTTYEYATTDTIDYAGLDKWAFRAMITGAYVRACYNENGMRYLGSQYDDVTDANGNILSTDANGNTVVSTDYYSYAVGTRFAIANGNFQIFASTNNTSKFIINPKTIDLSVNDFVGISKSYDKTDAVNFGNTVAYDLSGKREIATDELILAFNASYVNRNNLSEVGAIDANTLAGILFRNLRLAGNSAHNYKLGRLTNTMDDENRAGNMINGSVDTRSTTISTNTTLTIFYIDNNTCIEAITIRKGKVAVLKSDFTVTKTYDGTDVISKENVSISSESNSGATMISELWKQDDAVISTGEPRFTGSDANSYYVDLTLKFPIKGLKATDVEVDDDGAYADPPINIRVDVDEQAIFISITDLPATITQKVLGVDAFAEITPVDQDYSAQEFIVDTEFNLNQYLIVESDRDDIEIRLGTKINDGNVNVGTHTVEFVNMGEGKYDSFINNSNYTIDIEELNKYYTGENALNVNINKAKLKPNVQFVDREYDGTVDVEATGTGYQSSDALTTQNFVTELRDEVKWLSVDGNVLGTRTIQYKLSANGHDNANVVTDVDGNVIAHNVRVSGMYITVSENGAGLINLDNYELYGARYNPDTEEYESVAIQEVGHEIAPYEIIGAVVISRKTLRVTSNNVTIKNKVYDGTNEAKVDINLDDTGINPNDADKITVSATGKFDKPTVGENMSVIVSDLKIEGDEEVLNNYDLPRNFSDTRTASIVPRPIGLLDNTVNLGEMTYNGSARINSFDVTFTFDTKVGMLLNNEADGYRVQTLAGYAYYMDKNVNYDDHLDIVKSKNGTVFNPTLRNIRGEVNYELAMMTPDKIYGENYIAYVDKLGNMHYGEEVEDEESVDWYYYPLSTTDKYIVINPDNSKIIETLDYESEIAGRFVIPGTDIEVYALDSRCNREEVLAKAIAFESPMTYVKGEGRINQKPVSISANNIVIREGHESVLTKVFDGTAKFFGVEGTEKDGLGDYYYRNGGIAGLIEGDDLKVVGAKAEFNSADTNATKVVFTASGTDGDDKYNYIIISDIGSAGKDGHILPREIDAILSNGEMEYGTLINTVVGQITYKAHGNDFDTKGTLYDLTEWEGGLFMTLQDYTAMMVVDFKDYQDVLLDRIYEKVMSEDEKVFLGFSPVNEFDAENENYYIRLSGIATLPGVKAEFNVSNPTVGDGNTTARSYTLTHANATSYSFVSVYCNSDGKEDRDLTTGILKVVPRNLYVSSPSTKNIKIYTGNDPSLELYFTDKNGNAGFAPSENAFSVFVQGGKNLAPVLRWGIYNKTDKTWTMLGASKAGDMASDEDYKTAFKYAQISEKLKADEVYMARFFVPTDVDYATNTLIKNYNVILSTEFGVVEEDGSIVMIYDGNFTASACTLEINLPEMIGVTLRGAENNTFYYTYDGKDHVSDVLQGVREGDKVSLKKDGSDNAIEAIHFGEYTGHVIVERTLKIDESDKNGYTVPWRSEQEITISIAKANPELKAVTTSKYYDGKAYKYQLGVDNMISFANGLNIDSKYVDITYKTVIDGEEVEVKEMLNAGIYTVTVALNEEFAKANPDYTIEAPAVATYTILRVLVNVTISTDGYAAGKPGANANKTLIAAYDSNKTSYEIEYSIKNMSGLPQELQLPKSQTELVFEKEITSAGRYAFSIKLKQVDGGLDINNYRLEGALGMLELTTKTVETESSDTNVTVGTAIVANKLVTKELVKGKGNGTDIELWSNVNEYMPYIDKNAKLESIVTLGIYCDDTLVAYNGGDITVSVAIPETVGSLNGKAIYTVTAEGGLKLLNDYKVENGKIVYDTDYLGAIVFVDLTPSAMPLWQIILIAVCCALVVITIVWTVVAYVLRKSKLKKLA